MTPKEIVEKFYKSEALIDSELMKEFLHPEVMVECSNSQGFHKLDHDSLLSLSGQFAKAYVRSKVRISHIIAENDMVSMRYSHYVKTIQNPREEILLAHSIAIWQIKDNALFRGYQMSQL